MPDQPNRFQPRPDTVHRRHVGVWDNDANTWVTDAPGEDGDARFAAGVPMWSAKRAGEVAARLNTGATPS